MKVRSDGRFIFEDGEPVLRSCPECNGAHAHLRDVTLVHYCFICGRYWLRGRYLDEFETVEELVRFVEAHDETQCA